MVQQILDLRRTFGLGRISLGALSVRFRALAAAPGSQALLTAETFCMALYELHCAQVCRSCRSTE